VEVGFHRRPVSQNPLGESHRDASVAGELVPRLDWQLGGRLASAPPALLDRAGERAVIGGDDLVRQGTVLLPQPVSSTGRRSSRGFHHPSLSRYHATVSFMPSSNEISGAQPNSVRSLVESSR